MLSVLAGWRVSLRRVRTDWPIMAAATLTMLLATTLLAAGPIYSAAVSVAGLRQKLAEASIEAGNVQVSASLPLSRVEAVDRAISDELTRVAGNLPANLAHHGTSGTFALPGQGSEVRDLMLPGFAEGIEEHATLVAGEWPVSAPEPPPGEPASLPPVQVAISDAVGDELQLQVGDRLDAVSRLDTDLVLPITIAGVFRVDDPNDPYWWSDKRVLDGVTVTDQYRTYGPFLMTREDLLDRAAVTSVAFSWRLMPSYAAISIDDVAGLRSRLTALPARLRLAAEGQSPTITTDLPDSLAAASRSLLVSRTGMLLVMVQLALLGGYAILLTAGLLIDHRRVETAMLRSRGAGPAQVAGLAVVEGLLLAVPAVLLGPLFATVALNLFDRVGPMAQVGLAVPLQITSDAYLAAAIAGAACVALLAVPALFSARSFRTEQGSLSREETRPLAQRLGIDLALLAVAAVAIWQLRLYGGPLTRTLQGTLGPDPLLVAAPALGLLLGAVVATRLLPRLAEAAQRVLARGRGLVGALGSYQLARRPLRYTRSALMLMLAMSIAVFAVSYATTWTDSQRSQAEHQVGADVRVIPSRSQRSLPASALGAAYAALPGVAQATPVERHEVALNRSLRGALLAVDADAIPSMANLRADQADASLTELMTPLADARPIPALPAIPDGAGSLRITTSLDIRGVERRAVDPASGEPLRLPEDVAAFDREALIGLSVAVRDEHGVIHRFSATPRNPGEARVGIDIPLAGVARPLELVSIDADVLLPPDLVVTDGSISITDISQADLGTPDEWMISWLDPIVEPFTVAGAAVDGLGVRIGGGDGQGDPPHELATDGSHPLTISMQPAAIADIAQGEVPVLVNQQTLDATALEKDDVLRTVLAGAERRLRVVGVVDSFPTTDADNPLIVADLPTLALLRFQAAHGISADVGAAGETRLPDEWWLDLNAGADTTEGAAVADDVSGLLNVPPFNSTSVSTVAGRVRTLVSDPVAVGIIGALAMGALAAALFAFIGLAVAASVSARQRQAEFAVIRALGLSRRQLSAWLWLENGSLALVSLLVGTALGVLMAWVVLPSVTVTADGLPPTPPTIVALPLPTIALIAVMAAAALAVVVVVVTAVLRRIDISNVLRLGEE